MVVAVITGLILKISLPMVQNALLNRRLTAASASLAEAIQQTRGQAIIAGCPYAIVFRQDSTTYQVKTDTAPGAPRICAATLFNVGSEIAWTSGGGICMSPSTTLQFNPDGTAIATTGTLSFSLSNGFATRTITVSGVGNVTVTSP